jgi:hypothetical protein
MRTRKIIFDDFSAVSGLLSAVCDRIISTRYRRVLIGSGMAAEQVLGSRGRPAAAAK